MAAQSVLDRHLWLRTVISMVLYGLGGVLSARAVATVLAAVTMPASGKYVRTVAFDNDLKALASIYPNEEGGQRLVVFAIFAFIIISAIAFLPLFNRTYYARGAVKGRGWPTYALTLIIFAALELFVCYLPGFFLGLPGNALFANTQDMASGFGLELGFLLAMALSGLDTAIMFVIFGELALNGQVKGRQSPGAKTLLMWALMGFLCGAIISTVSSFASEKIGLLLSPGLEFLGQSGEVSLLGWQRIELGLMFGLGLPAAFAGGLVVASAPTPASKKARVFAMSLALIPAIIVFVVGMRFEQYCIKDAELGIKTLKEAAGLKDAQGSRLIVVSSPTGPLVREYSLKVPASGFISEEEVLASLENIKLIEAYLGSHAGHYTVHTNKAYNVLSAMYDRLLMPTEAIKAALWASEKTSSVLLTMMLIVRLDKMPTTLESAAVANALLDPHRFVAAKEGKLKLLPITRHGADVELVKTLKDKALEEGAKLEGGAVLPEGPEFAAGIITGQVSCSCLAGIPVRVALLSGDAPPDKIGRTFAVKLLAAADVEPAGQFSFTGLVAGEYNLMLLLPESCPADSGKLQATGYLGPFAIEEGAPKVDAGSISILSIGG